MTTRPVIPVRVASGKPSAQALANMDKRWRVRYLMLAPHRLGFFLAMVVLVASGLWWALVQLDRSTGWLALPSVISPTLVHSAVMAFGFIPLFFSGFLFTAGPKWLGVEAPLAKDLRVPLFSLAAGWLLWLVGAHLHAGVAWAGLALACFGLVWMTVQFWGRIRRSQAPDQLHARVIGTACMVGCASLAGLLLSLVFEAHAAARAWVFTGLWGFVVVVYVTVAHRMIPFFTSNVLPLIELWRPFWVLRLMLGVAAFEVLALWVDFFAPSQQAWPAWTVLVIAVELAAGGVLLWLAVVWGLVQSLKIRLLAMLHVGFVWLGLALLYSAASQALWLATGQPVLGLGALHALSMGFLGSIMVAMVTRVSCGHSGRALVADNPVWAMFWLLQVAIGVRLLAAVQGMPMWLTALAALLWTAIVTAWALRYANWYGRPRIDGKAG